VDQSCKTYIWRSIVAHGDQGCNLHLDMADWLVSFQVIWSSKLFVIGAYLGSKGSAFTISLTLRNNRFACAGLATCAWDLRIDVRPRRKSLCHPAHRRAVTHPGLCSWCSPTGFGVLQVIAEAISTRCWRRMKPRPQCCPFLLLAAKILDREGRVIVRQLSVVLGVAVARFSRDLNAERGPDRARSAT